LQFSLSIKVLENIPASIDLHNTIRARDTRTAVPDKNLE